MGVSLKRWLVVLLLALFLWPAGASAKGERSERRERGASSMRSSGKKKVEGKRARRERKKASASKRSRARRGDAAVDAEINAHLRQVASLPPAVTPVDEPPPAARPVEKEYVQPVDQWQRMKRVGREIPNGD